MVLPKIKRIGLKQKFLTIHEEYEAITGDYYAGVLLSYFEGWYNFIIQKKENKTRDTKVKRKDSQIYQYHTKEQIYSDCMGAISYRGIKIARKILVDKGFVTEHKNPNPKYNFDNTVYYELHIEKINEALDEYEKTLTQKDSQTSNTGRNGGRPSRQKSAQHRAQSGHNDTTQGGDTETRPSGHGDTIKYYKEHDKVSTVVDTSFSNENNVSTPVDKARCAASGAKHHSPANTHHSNSPVGKQEKAAPCSFEKDPADVRKCTNADVSMFLQAWVDAGFGLPKKGTKTHNATVKAVKALLDGSLFLNTRYADKAKEYSFSDFTKALKRFKLAATDAKYLPANKEKLIKAKLYDFLFNPYVRTQDGAGLSYFLIYLSAPPKEVPIPRIQTTTHTKLYTHLLSQYKKHVLQDPKAKVSPKVEDAMCVAADFVYNLTKKYALSDKHKAEVFFRSLSYCKMDISKMPLHWYRCEWLYEDKFKPYLSSGNCIYPLITQQEKAKAKAGVANHYYGVHFAEEQRRLAEAVTDF